MVFARPIHLLTSILLLLTTLSAAWPWPAFLPERDSILVRQDSSSSSSAASPAATGSTAKETASASNSRSASGSATGTVKASSSGSSTTAKKASATAKTSYDARLPAGGVTLVEPAATVTSYYKIGDFVTFAWNFTSLSATPTAINIMATCSINSQLYTIAENQSIDATSVVWDTGAYQNTAAIPFPVASYTLLIYDSGSKVTAPAAAGYLAAYSAYKFGMYTPQAYTPLNEFVCATCSGALSNTERQALGTVTLMSVITVLSFTWFIGGLHVVF